MALAATPSNPSVTHRDPVRTAGQAYVGGDLAVAGAMEVDGAQTLRGVVQGGSPVLCQRMEFKVAQGGAAGTLDAAVTLPAGAMLLDVVVHSAALWNAGTSAALDVGDDTDPDGYFAAFDMKATDMLVGESVSFVGHGGKPGAYIVGTLPTGHWESRWQAAARTVQAKLTLVGTTATTGETYVDVFYVLPSAAHTVQATFTAA
jgi:hypothetical protein